MPVACRTILAGLAAAAVLAAPASPASAPSFNRADVNNDGVVTFEEARMVMRRLTEVHFSKCDRDGDGRLNRHEYRCLASLYDTMYGGF